MIGFIPSEPDLRISRHTALQSVVLPSRGLAYRVIGLFQAKQTKIGKVSIVPSCLVSAIRSGASISACPLAQDGTQPAPYKTIFHAERRMVAVFEVFVPSAQNAVHIPDDLGHAVARGAFGLRPDRISELMATFASRPATASLEVIAKKVKGVGFVAATQCK
jgi:hypothetical protein